MRTWSLARPSLASFRVPLALAAWVAAGLLAPQTAEAAVGGPDGFGYAWYNQASGATYNYVNIQMTGSVVATGDDVIASQPLGAAFSLYGTVYNDLAASTNGFLSDQSTNSDFGNTCPRPGFVDGGGARIAVLHDDLDTTVYYQYFDAAAAATAGFTGTTLGVSIFQWVGTHHISGTAVNFEVVLFHDSGSMHMQFQTDGDGGSGSTTAIQDGTATNGLTFVCNTVGSITGGTTAVRFAPTPADVHINEIRVDQTGTDNDEYVEIVGTPGASLDRLAFMVVGDGTAIAGTGVIENLQFLSGRFIPANGRFVIAEPTFTLGTATLTVGAGALNFENSDTVTHMVVRDFSSTFGTDLDTNNDGVFDTTPWTALEDVVALVNASSGELPYGPGSSCVAGTDCNQVAVGNTSNDPNHVFRCTDGTGSFNLGLIDPTTLPTRDTPGAANRCACGDGVIIIGETCDDAGESAACDSDCSTPSCGDALLNVAAGESCDGGGETAACNADCTVATCGDGILNVTAGEQCDDAGESGTCDIDCSFVACGDGIANATAGEQCDDAGESATCDTDCTTAVCGDSTVNFTAGETCDDGGRSPACNFNCTVATCGDGIVNLLAGEECDGDGNGNPGETATCDLDCTAAICGDAVFNASAGEQCDDGGKSVSCDNDCTLTTCGDGHVNFAAGEQCDDAGESATCDLDCSDASCGDGQINATAGEDCDDAGESATCDPDCSSAACGDGVLNATAGEQCDDGNVDDGDGCSSACVVEIGGSSDGGGSSGGGSSGGGSSGGGSSDGGGSSGGGSTGGGSTGGGSSEGGSSGGGSSTGAEGSSTGGSSSGAESSSGGGGSSGADTQADTSGGGSGGGSSSDASASASATAGDTEAADSGSSDGGGTPSTDDGCGCTTEGNRPPVQALLGLVGLMGLRRRRRRG
ncbi:MAG: hypothetical protein K1X88_04110 [Nannocystaceae bacterium]|nr:hypothetical protein [Nannocystaceae bacterium]